MPPKKATSAAPKKGGAPAHAPYRDMIKDAIVNLKERNGSSRQSIKKYVLANNNITVASPAAFDAQFNKAIKAGVEKGEFTQPKGPSGPVKLAKKEQPAKPAAKPAAKPTTTKTKKTPAKKAEKPEKPEKAEKPAKPKRAANTTKKSTAGRPKANTAKPRSRKTTTTKAAPAIVEQPKVIGKTKSGRVTKSLAKPEAKTTRTKKTTGRMKTTA